MLEQGFGVPQHLRGGGAGRGGALASILWPPLQDGLCLPSTSERVQHGLSSVLRFVSL